MMEMGVMRKLVVTLGVVGLALSQTLAAQAYEPRHIFVTNRGGNNVVELTDDLTFVRTWFDAEGLNTPNGMAFTPDGRLFVADTFNNRIVAFDATGSKIVEFPVLDVVGPNVESLNFNAAGQLYITSNPGNGVIPLFTDLGVFVSNLENNPSFVYLGNINTTGVGTVIISSFDASYSGIREVAPDTGTVMRSFGDGISRFEDMAVDGADRIFVSAFEDNNIVTFNPDRTELRRFGEGAGLNHPTGVVITHDCRVIVSSFLSNEIFEFTHEGLFLSRHTYPGLTSPESLAIAYQGIPGAQAEFTDFVPRCDPGDISDAGMLGHDGGGVTTDAGNVTTDAGSVDASAIASDASTRDAGNGTGSDIFGHADSSSDCGCRVVGAASPMHQGAWCACAFFVALTRLRARSRHRNTVKSKIRVEA